MNKLNLGSGNDVKEGYINLDYIAADGIDIVHDLDSIPYPFIDNYFDEIYAAHTLEHLKDLIGTMRELHRICKPGAKITIRVPHFSAFSNYADPTHKKLFSYSTFDFFTSTQFFQKRNESGMFNILKKRINYFPMHLPSYKLNWIFYPLLNWFPRIYERLLHGIFPAAELYFQLEVCK
jgi:predicted SAM-dependent methyltransferase